MAEKEKVEKKDRFVIGEIATQTDLVIIDTETDTKYNVLTFLAKIGNDLEMIKKTL